jgi:AcrR family transcriptional regulator
MYIKTYNTVWIQSVTDNQLLRAVSKRGIQASEGGPLQRFDWMLKALHIFITEGIDAVRITRLADELSVTRGSFYWHFENREDLIDALVGYWRDKNTRAISDAMDNASSLSDGIFRFFETCLDSAEFDPRLDLAVREWARRSPSIRNQVDEADQLRIEAFRSFFCRFGYEMPEALIRARTIYFSQIGFYALEVQEPLEIRISYTEVYFECFTGQKPDPVEVESFNQHIRQKYGPEVPAKNTGR